MKSLNKAGLTGCLLMLAVMYFVLLGPDKTIFSVYTLCHLTQQMPTAEEILVICLLPIYFSLMIFGGASLGWFAGTKANLAYKKIANHH